MSSAPIVVGIDGSANSRLALAWAVEYGRRYQAPVHAFITQDVLTEAQTQAILDDVVQDVVGDSSQVVKRIERGHPAPALVDASTTAQLIVVGTRGRGAFVGMLLGSVSQHCVAHAHCPVVVVPQPDPH